MNEARLPSGDPLSTRTRPEGGSWVLGIREADLAFDLFEEEQVHEWRLDDPLGPLLEDSDLRR